MTADRVALTNLNPFIEGVSPDLLARLTNPQTDPARQIPDYPETTYGEIDEELPTVEEIEQALVDHVRGGPAPRDLIERLFHPFVEGRLVDLEPGKGQKRPSYALSISPYDLIIPRGPASAIAQRLHRIGAQLSRFAVGDRAPEGAPELTLEIPGWSSYPSDITIRAANIATAHTAYITAFGRGPGGIQVPLEMTAPDLIPYVMAARSLLAEGVIGAPRQRERAVALIAASEDLRAVATVIAQRHPGIRTTERLSIDVLCDSSLAVEVEDEASDRSSSHGEMMYIARHRDLVESLKKAAARHPVLQGLPDGCAIRLRGEPSYLDASIVDRDTTAGTPRLKITKLDYREVGVLADILGRLETSSAPDRAHWKLSLTNGRIRSKSSWDLYGETLAKALADAVETDSISASMTLMDLAIDLLSGSDGASPEISLSRIV